jgi:putative membrane protein insertion efficiency factor
MKIQKIVKIEEDPFELNLESKDAIIVERHLTGYTQRDLKIGSLSIPKHPVWLNIIIRLIRFYRKHISHKLGNRCVFDPSCSHYSEIAFRKKGFLKGSQLTINRLFRCTPKNGGIDELF